MGEHDQTVLTGGHAHVEDMHEDINDDGRTLRRIEMDGYAGVGGGAEDEAYNDTPVYRYSHDKLIPDTVHIHSRPFSITKWEAMFSTLFGNGTSPDWICPSVDPGLEPSFTPVIDESYRVVGHLGWIDGIEIRVPKNTVAWNSPVAHIFEEQRLGEDRRRILAMHDRPLYPFPVHPATTSPALESRWEPFIASLRKGPLKDASDEQRHQNNINYFMAGGGTAFVGNQYLYDLIGKASWEYESLLPGGYRCFALVRPDGCIQSVSKIEPIPHESRDARILRHILTVVDIALTIWMIIDIATIPVALFRLTLLVAERVEIWAIKLALDRGAKAALELAMREAIALSEAGALAGPKAAIEQAMQAAARAKKAMEAAAAAAKTSGGVEAAEAAARAREALAASEAASKATTLAEAERAAAKAKAAADAAERAATKAKAAADQADAASKTGLRGVTSELKPVTEEEFGAGARRRVSAIDRGHGARPFNGTSRNRPAAPWTFNPKVDVYVTTHDEAIAEAFRRTGAPMNEFEATKVAKTAEGKTITVEWTVKTGPNRGAEVNIDDPRIVPSKNGPQAPHVGYRTAKGEVVGHVFPREGVLASRSRILRP